MASTMSLKLTGLKELEAELASLKDRATSRRVADRALRKMAEPIRDRAKELAPDDPSTGEGKYLVESIKIGRAAGVQQKLGNSGTVVSTFVGIDGSVLPASTSSTGKRKPGVAAISIFRELGTERLPAQPYLRPAFEENKQEAVDGAAEVLSDEIMATKARAARKAARKAG